MDASTENEPIGNDPKVLELTAQIVAAHVSHNPVTVEALPQLIQDIYRTLATLGRGRETPPTPQPAVPIRKSIHPDYIICLEDGKKLKMLRRHLKTVYNMTPEQYREKWGLPPDYPMVAPNYAKRRSMLAKNIGLGTRHRRSAGGTEGMAEEGAGEKSSEKSAEKSAEKTERKGRVAPVRRGRGRPRTTR